MPAYLDVFHPDRVAVLVLRGTVTLEDFERVFEAMRRDGQRGYSKIIDTTTATFDGSEHALSALAALLRAGNPERRGPVAFVVNPDRQEPVEIFASLTEGDRPVRIFTSLRQAREWVSASR